MTGYRAVFDDTGDEAVEPMASYRAVFDAARSEAQCHQSAVRVVDAVTGRAEMIVRPDGTTRRP